MTIDEVKNFVEFVVNVEQTGRVRPKQFNLAANFANYELFTELLGNPWEYKPGMNIPKIRWQSTKIVSDALSPFIVSKKEQLKLDGKIYFPSDYVMLNDLRINHYRKENGKTKRNEIGIEIVDHSELADRLSSFMYAIMPSIKYPIAAEYSGYFEVWPKVLNTVHWSYLRKPKDVKWGYTTINNRPDYSDKLSTDYEWGEVWHNELCVRILRYYGINMARQDIAQYGQLMKKEGV